MYLTFNCRGGDKKEKKKILEYVFFVQKWIPTQAGTRLRRTDYTYPSTCLREMYIQAKLFGYARAILPINLMIILLRRIW